VCVCGWVGVGEEINGEQEEEGKEASPGKMDVVEVFGEK